MTGRKSRDATVGEKLGIREKGIVVKKMEGRYRKDVLG